MGVRRKLTIPLAELQVTHSVSSIKVVSVTASQKAYSAEQFFPQKLPIHHPNSTQVHRHRKDSSTLSSAQEEIQNLRKWAYSSTSGTAADTRKSLFSSSEPRK